MRNVWLVGCVGLALSGAAQAEVPAAESVALANAARAYVQSLKEYDLLLQIYGQMLRTEAVLSGQIIDSSGRAAGRCASEAAP